MIELALATGTAPSDWWDEPPQVIVTAIAVLASRSRKQATR